MLYQSPPVSNERTAHGTNIVKPNELGRSFVDRSFGSLRFNFQIEFELQRFFSLRRVQLVLLLVAISPLFDKFRELKQLSNIPFHPAAKH